MNEVDTFKKEILKIISKIDNKSFNEEKAVNLLNKVLSKTLDLISYNFVLSKSQVKLPSYTDVLESIIEKDVENEVECILVLLFFEYVRNLVRWSLNPLHMFTQEVNLVIDTLYEKINKYEKEKSYFEGLPYA